ncbi:YARHG domain-containing protein [Flavobacterium sp. HNIBRBA15423]|uniref:YARHG domain-containing protein n=1 Tax=Flavobacterium sp. HNIBRBA15423 TaxID=3458683 RepID=UPI004044C2CA
MINKNTLLFFTLCFSYFIFSQNIGATEINPVLISSWEESDLEKYEGMYHFGEGDGSNLILLVNDDKITIQIRETRYWSEGGCAIESGLTQLSELELKWEYKNLTNVKIINGKLFSNEYSGEFVTYKEDLKTYFGLKINNPWNTWIGKNRYEIGIKNINLDLKEYFFGQFPNVSISFLNREELASLFDNNDLALMRNEIFARYGYKFNKNGKFDIHFKNQNWYQPKYKDVKPFLTEIELHNIAIIKEIEESRKENTYIPEFPEKNKRIVLTAKQDNLSIALVVKRINEKTIEYSIEMVESGKNNYTKKGFASVSDGPYLGSESDESSVSGISYFCDEYIDTNGDCYINIRLGKEEESGNHLLGKIIKNCNDKIKDITLDNFPTLIEK